MYIDAGNSAYFLCKIRVNLGYFRYILKFLNVWPFSTFSNQSQSDGNKSAPFAGAGGTTVIPTDNYDY